MKTMRLVEVSGKFEIGDVISVKLNNGVEIDALAVKAEFDEENGNTMTFIMNCLPEKLCSHKVDEFISDDMEIGLDEEFKELAIPYDNGNLFRLPAKCEIVGNVGESSAKSNEQFELMDCAKNRLGFSPDGEVVQAYWTGTASEELDGEITRVFISEYGEDESYLPEEMMLRVRPVFRLKNSGN